MKLITYKDLENTARENDCFNVISEFEDYWDDNETFESNVKMIMDALCDGSFLSRQEWTEDEVGEAYDFLENVLLAEQIF